MFLWTYVCISIYIYLQIILYKFLLALYVNNHWPIDTVYYDEIKYR